ncbi:MAG: MarR family transcriptional regulator [Candidatus Pacearchaeota archaeon]
MKKNFLLILFIIGIFIPSLVSAGTNINIYLSENGDAEFYGKTNENILLPDGIFIKDGNILGTTKTLTKKDGEIWFFNYSLKNSNLNLILPKDSVIKELRDGEIYLEGGYLSIYNDESLEVYYTIRKHSYLKYYIYLGLGILLFILIFLLYRKLKNEFKKNEDIEIIKKTLNERENLIIDKLKEVKEIKQSRLSKLTGIPKASLFRHLVQLEKKGIIRRTGDGKNKIISLK